MSIQQRARQLARERVGIPWAQLDQDERARYVTEARQIEARNDIQDRIRQVRALPSGLIREADRARILARLQEQIGASQ